MQFRETPTKPILPAELAQPGFWGVFLPDLVSVEGDFPEWLQRLEPDFPDGLAQPGKVVRPELSLSLPHGYRLILWPSSCSYLSPTTQYASEVSYCLYGADLPDNGFLGDTDCHCQLPILRWSEARQLAKVLQQANPMLAEGAALLLLWSTLWLNDPEFQEAAPSVFSSLEALRLKPGHELTNLSRIPHEGQSACGELLEGAFQWWEREPGDWVNNSPYSLRSITAYEEVRWDDDTRRKFNRVLRELSVNGPTPAP